MERSESDLNQAINELEEVLNERHGIAGPSSSPEDAPVDGPEETSRGEQYTIPLLHEVVAPPTVPEPSPAEDRAEVALEQEVDPVQDEAARFRPIIERLTSEIEVIVQTGVEEALKVASKDILRKVNEHVEIVLPEILEELSLADRDGDG